MKVAIPSWFRSLASGKYELHHYYHDEVRSRNPFVVQVFGFPLKVNPKTNLPLQVAIPSWFRSLASAEKITITLRAILFVAIPSWFRSLASIVHVENKSEAIVRVAIPSWFRSLASLRETWREFRFLLPSRNPFVVQVFGFANNKRELTIEYKSQSLRGSGLWLP